uniref:SMB domain-containing protein n=1 Tax=Panagrellus redivivus TaxID=6233 RepID=A0A7E5A2E4_PANRE
MAHIHSSFAYSTATELKVLDEPKAQFQWFYLLYIASFTTLNGSNSNATGKVTPYPSMCTKSAKADKGGYVVAVRMGPPWSLLPGIIFISILNGANAGCYQQKLCCTGRNATCRSKDDGLRNLPLVAQPPSVRLLKLQGEVYPSVYDVSGEQLGRLILPDMVEVDDIDKFKDKLGGHAEFLTFHDGEQYRKKNTGQNHPKQYGAPIKMIKQIKFGDPFDDIPTPDIVSSEKGKAVIRLSKMNRFLPVTIGEVPDYSQPLHERPKTPASEYPNYEGIMYLTEADPDCFCDETCVQYGDCCSDYTYVCAPTDCKVSDWSPWTECKSYQGNCGQGRQDRVRKVTNSATHGGMPCPALLEARACHVECDTKEPTRERNGKDKTTVALLLPYKYHDARKAYKVPKKLIPLRNHTTYCGVYKLGWVNRNCVEKELKSQLKRGTEICSECQPEAQYHRQQPRCASDLQDGEKGLWKVIGPPSCYGFWFKVKTIQDCTCSINPEVKQLPQFLHV